MEKVVDFECPIYEMAKDNPEFIQIMYDLGFTKIKIPGMLTSVGRIVNLKKGSRAMGIDLQEIKAKFEAHGYEVKNFD
ncbi:DUF1858 domain-containing protein [Ligilactobacillus equi]|uniref:DUF1858 domain-containing protein n=1 Tax=Ligilactobacillus equi TaxID=137357 RepID=UPI002ED35A0B